jgi:hypothetical protein
MAQSDYLKLKNAGSWFTAVPITGLTYRRSATDLAGTYTITFSNYAGQCNGLFTHFANQEIWLLYPPTGVLYRVLAGQINAITPKSNFLLELNGRGLSGMLTDQKVSSSWASKRGDFILCDPTYGAIPTKFPNVTTWQGFTSDYDKFDSYSTSRWGTQPGWAELGRRSTPQPRAGLSPSPNRWPARWRSTR